MPFDNIEYLPRVKTGNEIDNIIVTKVLPNLEAELSNEALDYYPILPNGKPSLFVHEKGPTNSHNPKKYFALSCLENKLSYPEIGYWLDTAMCDPIRTHTDRKKRFIIIEQESSLRFDHRKPIYQFRGICRRYLTIRK